MSLDALRMDHSIKQKKGIHFILASILIWGAVLVVQMLAIPILTKNLYTFCCTAPLMPIAYFISKSIRVNFTNKENPLAKLGLIFSLNQMLYLLIAMWVYPTVPAKMVMVMAIIFGAHLLPFAWLYQSIGYAVFSVIISLGALFVGCASNAAILSMFMVGVEILFAICLILENRLLSKRSHNECASDVAT